MLHDIIVNNFDSVVLFLFFGGLLSIFLGGKFLFDECRILSAIFFSVGLFMGWSGLLLIPLRMRYFIN